MTYSQQVAIACLIPVVAMVVPTAITALVFWIEDKLPKP
jgi:hypothetical protein